ncbi:MULTISPECIES: sugar ABC transporter permease [unclassified Paenibacillus]|uniref:carbohydrate ABC transporter permease n=1 Tax=unclassified Paenibacillus TaxID=185978 RepID=UPI0010EE57F5|nr:MULTISPECIES: sugar ABC transporter permease [unclassified Paenibacillus]NIK67395.1 multiple sugar transport system permease protein [Paenibacillus sp. BK720]TCN01438.1 multiple sugar transport system permease protein [Paenibacillus sp. BK033]
MKLQTEVLPSKGTLGRGRTARSRHTRVQFWCWLFVLPNLTLFLLFTGWPIAVSWYYSLLDWSGLDSRSAFIGLDNFKSLIADSYFWKAYRNTFVFMLGAVPLQIGLALAAAVILNHPKLRFAAFYRTVIFLPVVTTASIVGIIMVYIWASDGAVNWLLQRLHILNSPINWLGDADWALFTVIIIYVWKNLGINVVYWLAGLQSVPRELHEAAKVDGAGFFAVFRYITLPLIVPIGLIILLLDIAGALKVFDLVKTMTDGGPFFATDVVSTYIYRYAFSSELGLPRLGYASAAGILFAATVLAIGVIQRLCTGLGRRGSERSVKR